MKTFSSIFKLPLLFILFTWSLPVFSQNGQVLNFNGTGSYCTAPAFAGNVNNFTLEARVKWSGVTDSNQCILLNGSACCTGYAIYINNNDSLYLKLGGIALLSLHARLSAGAWQMLTLVRNSGTWAFYLDGVASSFTSTLAPNAIVLGSDSFQVGTNGNNSGFFYGSIDEVVFWNRPLCAGEISSQLSCQVSPSDAGLLGLYYFNEGLSAANDSAINILSDSSGNGNNLALENFALTGSTGNWLADTGALNTYCNAYIQLLVSTLYTPQLCKGTIDSLMEQPTGSGPFTYSWNTGSNNDTIAVRPTASSVYTVKVTDAYGCSAIDTDTVIVFLPPVVSITGKSPICSGVNDTLNGNATGGGLLQYLWSTNESTQSVIVAPMADSSFALWVTDSNNCADSAKIEIKVNPAPLLFGINYSSISGGICLGINDTVWEQVSGGPYTYSWSTGSSSDTLIVSPSVATTYTLSVADSFCTVSDSVSVLVYAHPVANITGKTSDCNGANDTLTGNITGTAPFQFFWSTNAATQSIIVMPQSDTSFELWVTDGNYCIDSAHITISVDSTPLITGMNSSSFFGLCEGVNDTIWVQAAGGPFTYKWNTGSTNDTIIVSPHDTTTYMVTVGEPDGCFSTGSFTANIFKNALKISGSSSITNGSKDTLVAYNGINFTWNGGIQGDSDIVAPTADSTFTVTGTNAYGCPDTVSFTVTILIAGIPGITEPDVISVYPNPSAGILKLAFDMNNIAKEAVIKIFDIYGNEMMASTAAINNGKIVAIDVSSLVSGPYFIKVSTAESSQAVKFIKQ
ncbi:MAG: LamG-like jellyroll fold domain-containing protein [Bacteroidia bacterium]